MESSFVVIKLENVHKLGIVVLMLSIELTKIKIFVKLS